MRTHAELERSERFPQATHATRIEAGLWIVGLLLLLSFGGLRLWFEAERSLGIEAFQYAHLQGTAGSASEGHPSSVALRQKRTSAVAPAQSSTPATHKILRFSAPSTGDWSVGRLAKYWASVSGGIPEAVMKIERLQLEVPIYSGVTELNLNRGAARLLNTSAWDVPGNTAIAAHRDGYFRPLQRIALGDEITVETDSSVGTLHYRVEDIRVVNPSDVEVLAPTSRAWLTLITCYPFHYVGPAPKRFIVKASRIEDSAVVVRDADRSQRDRVT